MTNPNYEGLLLIGDPHLEGRVPGFRKDDYPNVILDKLEWCLTYATENRLLPCILGDLFERPRENPNWLMVRLMQMMQGEILCLYGNHDVHYNPQLTPDDSLSLLITAGKLTLIDENNLWSGSMNGRPVVVGGSSYRQAIPKDLPWTGERKPIVVWMTHHDILIPGYDEGRIKPREIPGIDLLVNGHIHRRLENIHAGQTTWLTPGNISRRSRSDASKSHVPSVLRIDVTPETFNYYHVEVPFKPFEEVFHDTIVEVKTTVERSAFVSGLAELQARRTESGAGLMEFLKHNVQQFESSVADEILNLAREATQE
ncbi:metallophosphoesterase [Planctomicrobium sp. SH668]|uniref:metallophosphoesterase n=1 Tax=Planctomicrobium sp. SH668 TaxID=3448126 RepID=UPI003F5B12FF